MRRANPIAALTLWAVLATKARGLDAAPLPMLLLFDEDAAVHKASPLASPLPEAAAPTAVVETEEAAEEEADVAPHAGGWTSWRPATLWMWVAETTTVVDDAAAQESVTTKTKTRYRRVAAAGEAAAAAEEEEEAGLSAKGDGDVVLVAERWRTARSGEPAPAADPTCDMLFLAATLLAVLLCVRSATAPLAAATPVVYAVHATPGEVTVADAKAVTNER